MVRVAGEAELVERDVPEPAETQVRYRDQGLQHLRRRPPYLQRKAPLRAFAHGPRP